jgi:hypothetical protein
MTSGLDCSSLFHKAIFNLFFLDLFATGGRQETAKNQFEYQSALRKFAAMGKTETFFALELFSCPRRQQNEDESE